MFKAVVNADRGECKRLIEEGNTDLNAQDENKNTCLHLAVNKLEGLSLSNPNSFYDMLDIIDLLINKKADLNIQNNNLQTPLHLVCQQIQAGALWTLSLGLGIIKNFIGHESKPNIKDYQGNTCLHYLCSCEVTYKCSVKFVKYLLGNKADPGIRNKDNKTPRDLLQNKGSGLNEYDVEIINLLFENEKKKLYSQDESENSNNLDNFTQHDSNDSQLKSIKLNMSRSNYDINKINFISNFITSRSHLIKYIKYKPIQQPCLPEELYHVEKILHESDTLYKETKHSSDVFNLYDFDGKLYSKNNLNYFKIKNLKGISLQTDDERGDLLFISTAPLKNDNSLVSKSFVIIDLIRLEELAKAEGWLKVLEQKCYFRLFDPQCFVKKEFKCKFIITDKIHMELSEKKVLFIKENETDELTLTPSHFIYHGFSGISYFVKSFIFQLIAMLGNNPLKNEIYETLKNLDEEELRKIINDWSNQFQHVEINFFRELFLDWRYLNAIQTKDGMVNVKSMREGIEEQKFQCINDILEQQPVIKKVPFLMAPLEKIFIKKEVVFKQQKLSENICVLLKILTRAGLKNEEHLKISVSEQKLLISLILNKDVRDENGLQYDAERVLVSALTGHIQNYNPNRIKNYNAPFLIEINFSKKIININGEDRKTDLSGLKKVLECFIKTIVQLTLSGNFFRNSDPNIQPTQEKTPAVSYLNAYDGLLKQLPSGDVKVGIEQDKLFIYFNDNFKLEKHSKILLNAFSLNEKGLLLDENSSALIFSLNDFIKKIDKSAIQYLAINLIDEETGKLLILKRQHNYNSGIETVGLYCGTGGSTPFPHDPLASIMALISWKLGIERSELKEIFDQTAPKLMLQENDFASYSCFIPNNLMQAIKKGKGVDNQFYDPKKVQTMHIAEAIKFRKDNALLAQQLQVVSTFFQKQLVYFFKMHDKLIHIDEKYVGKMHVKLLLKNDGLIIKLTSVCGDFDLGKFKEKIQELWKLEKQHVNIINNSLYVNSVDPIKICLDFKLFQVKTDLQLLASKLLSVKSTLFGINPTSNKDRQKSEQILPTYFISNNNIN